MKLSYVWENYRWAGPDDITFFDIYHNNASALDFWSNLTASVPFTCNGSIITDSFSRNISIVGIAKPLDVLVELSTVYVGDGFGFSDPFTELDMNLLFQDGLYVSTQIRSSLNDGLLGHWHRMDYDPNFVSLLAPPVGQPESPTPPAKIGKLQSWAVALIVVACILVAVVVVVLLVVFVPAVKAVVHPFVKRSGYSKSGPSVESSTPASQGWNRGSKPQV